MNPSPDASLPGIEKLYAVKVIDKQAHKSDILLRLRREIELLESLDHPNIVKLHEVIETQFTIYVCMEYIEGCSLEQHLKNHDHGRVSEREARRIARELASAISHCHSRFVVHRDIKPANILLMPSGKAMLIDFGLGNTFSYRSRLNTICGSLPYYSPEIARGSSYTGPEVDIWCLGVVLYRMTVGRDPFMGATKRDVKLQITQDIFRPPLNLSPGLQTTLRTLLAPDSAHRRTLAVLENDPWFHEDTAEQVNQQLPPFLSEDRSMSENSRLSGATLVRQQSHKRQSLTDSYYYGYDRNGSLFGNHSAVTAAGPIGPVWQIDRDQPRLRKNRVRVVPAQDGSAQNDFLFRRDQELSLLQFLVPILRACQVSYYLHSSSRILCGTSFVKDLPGEGWSTPPSVALQKLVHQVGAAMTGRSMEQVSKQHLMPRCGVFSIDIVKAKEKKGGQGGGHLLIIKRLFGSSLTVQYFKKQLLYNATIPPKTQEASST
ncbi:hypothetical protein BGZ54_009191 [Gamsiella multidivaricata]|nr:hypothetical protein BGZ54_009191 [Gamsiella multidivaricata]